MTTTPLGTWSMALARLTSGRSDRSLVLHAPTGVGITLLTQMMTAAEDAGWIAGYAEAHPDQSLRDVISQALQLPLADLDRPTANATTRAALTTFATFTSPEQAHMIEPPARDAGTGQLDLDLSILVRAITAAQAEKAAGLALLINTAHDLSNTELASLCSLTHMANQRRWPLLIALAGTTELLPRLGNSKGYAERLFNYLEVETSA